MERNVTRHIRENRVNLLISNVRRGVIGPDFIVGSNGDTLLHIAIRYKMGDVVSALLNVLNASVTIQNYKGETAFFNACERGLIYFVKMFLRWRQNYSTYIDIANNDGMTPLLIAHYWLNKPICEHLILNGADLNRISRNGFFIENAHFTYRRSIALFNRNRDATPIRNFESPQPFVTVRRRIGFTPFASQSSSSVEEEDKEIVKETSSHLKNEYVDMLIELKKSCSICFEPYEKEKVVILKNCEHTVCTLCFPKLKNCHMCRGKI